MLAQSRIRQILETAAGKKVDMVMVHAPAAEKKAVQEGWAIKRSLIGSNEFYIVGPNNDPAKTTEAKSAAEAYARIAKTQSTFYSRGDNSGTHKLERGFTMMLPMPKNTITDKRIQA